MDFSRKKAGSSRSARMASKKSLIHFQESSLEETYPCSLQLYDYPPRDDISLQEFELLALERLKLLRIFEKQSSKYSMEWREKVETEIRKTGLESYLQIFRDSSRSVENRRRDHLSHFILRLAYSRTEELRRWFITQEVDLFRLRLQSTPFEELRSFMTRNNLNYTPLGSDEKTILGDKLNDGSPFSGQTDAFFKVHFTEALELVRTRKVYINDGFCYVPEGEMITLLHWMFKSLLAHNLALTAKILPNLDEDERLVRMLSDLDKRYVGSDYLAAPSERILPEMIGPLSKKDFPLCMKHIQDTLTRSHHLKYKTRLQYTLFLKGVGLTLEDALAFFRGEFTQSHVTSEMFDKEYTYNIRYQYGLEGKKVNWSPYNCLRIIKDNVGPGENHGCPYRHHDSEILKKELVECNVNGEDIKDIMKYAKDGHYQKACSCQFRLLKGYEISTGMINHPNQYFQESRAGIKGNANIKTSNVKSEKVLVYNE